MVSEIRLLDFFVQTLKLPEGQAREAVRNFKTAEAEMDASYRTTIDKKFEEQKETFATKQDIYSVREEIASLREELYRVKDELGQRISTLEVRMEQNTNKIVFWLVGTIFASSGLVVALIKLL